MFRRTSIALAAAVAGLILPFAASASAEEWWGSARADVASGELPPIVLYGNGKPALPNRAMIEMSKWGFRYVAGKQDTDLTVTYADGVLTYADTGTRRWRSLAKGCTAIPAEEGIAAACVLPPRFQDSMFVQVWPRLGDDAVDGSTLPEQFRMWVLADAGRDEFRGGAGDDFFNGAKGADVAHGGPGEDWIRTGPGRDRLFGGAGNDRIVGVQGRDRLRGGPGADRVEGGPGADVLRGGRGRDVLSCRGGFDVAYADARDRLRQCEQVVRVP